MSRCHVLLGGAVREREPRWEGAALADLSAQVNDARCSRGQRAGAGASQSHGWGPAGKAGAVPWAARPGVSRTGGRVAGRAGHPLLEQRCARCRGQEKAERGILSLRTTAPCPRRAGHGRGHPAPRQLQHKPRAPSSSSSHPPCLAPLTPRFSWLFSVSVSLPFIYSEGFTLLPCHPN